MASRNKVEQVQKQLNAALNTINDILKENFELKNQMHQLLTGKNENQNIRRTVDFAN
jgi:hypothetical protein